MVKKRGFPDEQRPSSEDIASVEGERSRVTYILMWRPEKDHGEKRKRLRRDTNETKRDEDCKQRRPDDYKQRQPYDFLLNIDANRKSLRTTAKHFQPFTFYHRVPPEFHRLPYCVNLEKDLAKNLLSRTKPIDSSFSKFFVLSVVSLFS